MMTDSAQFDSTFIELPRVTPSGKTPADEVQALIQEIRSGFVMNPNFVRARDSLQHLRGPDLDIVEMSDQITVAEASLIRGEKTTAIMQLTCLLRRVSRDPDESW